MISIQGQYYPGGTSEGQSATLNCAEQEGTLEVGATRLRLLLEQLEVSDRLAGLPRRLQLPDGGQFITLDNEAIDRWLASAGRRHVFSLLSFFEDSWHWALLALVAVPVVLFLLFTVGMPLIAKPLAAAIPQSVKEPLDARILGMLDERVLAPSELAESKRDALTHLYGKLRSVSGTKLLYRNGGALGANAFALPGGTIVLTDELVELIDSDGEFIAVAAHETGHVALNHSMRNLVQAAGAGLVLGWILGDLSAVTDLALVGVPGILQQLSYSRKLETEADQYALGWLSFTGYSPACLSSLLTKLADRHGGDDERFPDFFSSHPSTASRTALGDSVEPCRDSDSTSPGGAR
jgi:Zn-dependent protease with chaperone function